MKKHRQPLLNIFVILLFGIFCAASCNPPEPPSPMPADASAYGVYVLNEGLFQHNNCTLSYYDFENQTLTPDIFLQVNQRGLGDTGNDLKRYGSKLYCVVNNSHRVEVMDFETAKSIKAIPLSGKSPRQIAFYQGKAYVSCFDGDVVRIDTATLEVEQTVHSGENPEGICVCNGKLYVANSGGLNNPDYGTTVSVFDISTLTMLRSIEVGLNPFKLAASDDNRTVYVCTRGDYMEQHGTFSRIDAQTDQITRTWPNIQNFTVFQDKAYVYEVDYEANVNPVKVLNLNQEGSVAEDFITDGTVIQMPYNITVNPLNGDVYITDAYNFTVTGDVYCFDKNGKKKFSFSAGLNPSAIVFKQ